MHIIVDYVICEKNKCDFRSSQEGRGEGAREFTLKCSLLFSQTFRQQFLL